MKLKKPEKGTSHVPKIYSSHTLNEILPHLPFEECFFDTRTWVVASLDEPLPFSVTTKINSNNQQFIRIRVDK